MTLGNMRANGPRNGMLEMRDHRGRRSVELAGTRAIYGHKGRRSFSGRLKLDRNHPGS
jgi:hypothetical protein